MLEARLSQAVTLKKVLDAVKDLVSDANLDCNEAGIALQAMDTSHVALVALLLRAEGFEPYRCDRNMSLGVNFGMLAKVLRCAQNDDQLTLKAADDADVLSLTFERAKTDRISEFDVKLMDVDVDALGIPETDYHVEITMPSTEFAAVCREMAVTGETVAIECIKDTLKFACAGEVGRSEVTLKPTRGVDAKPEEEIVIRMQQPVSLSFSLKYLTMFSKAGALAPAVTLKMSEDVPLLVEYHMEDFGYCRFYLAPKIGDE